MKIEWAMACDGGEATPSGGLIALGLPIDTTWIDEFPADDFTLDVTLCIVTQNPPDGGTAHTMRYLVTDDARRVVASLEFSTLATVFNDGAWPKDQPIRSWSLIRIPFPVSAPGFFRVAIGLDDQEPVRFGHLVKRDE